LFSADVDAAAWMDVGLLTLGLAVVGIAPAAVADLAQHLFRFGRIAVLVGGRKFVFPAIASFTHTTRAFESLSQ
jgi:hypothetical protein